MFFFFPRARERASEQKNERRICLRPEGRARCFAAPLLLSLSAQEIEYDVLSASAWKNRGEEVALREKGQDLKRREETILFGIGRPSSLVARRFCQGKKNKGSEFSPFLSASVSLLSQIQIRRWGPVVSEDPLKRRQVVYLSERVSFCSFFRR